MPLRRPGIPMTIVACLTWGGAEPARKERADSGDEEDNVDALVHEPLPVMPLMVADVGGVSLGQSADLKLRQVGIGLTLGAVLVVEGHARVRATHRLDDRWSARVQGDPRSQVIDASVNH